MLHISISNMSGQPIYEQIEMQIKNAVISGQLAEGEALPSLRYLAKELKVSIISTKRAYEELEREGYITSVPGKGSFVSPRDLGLIREEHLRQAEEAIGRAVLVAKSADISLPELEEMLHTLYEEQA